MTRWASAWTGLKARVRGLGPDSQALLDNRWLRWLGPALHRPGLWHVSRRGIALGAAIGVFFGLLIPLAQIPVSAAMAVVLRANLPAAVASTLVTNPLTFAPVYYAAYRVGSAILGEPAAAPPPLPAGPPDAEVGTAPAGGWMERTRDRLFGMGKPLVLGLFLFAVGFGGLVYVVVHLAWRAQVLLKRRRRTRAARRGA